MKFKKIISISLFQHGALVINLFTQVAFTSLIAMEEFGSFAKAAAIKEVLVAFLALSLGMSFIKIKYENRERLIVNAFLLAIIQALVILIFGSLLATIIFTIDLVHYQTYIYLLLLIFSFAMTALYKIVYSVYEKEEKFVFNSIINFLVIAVVSLLSLFWAFKFHDAYALVYKDLFQSLFMMFIYLGMIFYQYGTRVLHFSNFDKKLIIEVLEYSKKMYFNRLVEALYFRLDILVVGIFFSEKELGIYERAKYFAQLPMLLLSTFINRINFVKYSKNFSSSYFMKTNFYAILLNSIGYFLLYSGLTLISVLSPESNNWTLVQEYYLIFFAFSIAAYIENYKTMLYAKGNVYQAMLYFRIPSIMFFLIALFILKTFIVTTTYVGILYSLSYLLPVFFITKVKV